MLFDAWYIFVLEFLILRVFPYLPLYNDWTQPIRNSLTSYAVYWSPIGSYQVECRVGISTIDPISTLRQILKKIREQEIHHIFVDLINRFYEAMVVISIPNYLIILVWGKATHWKQTLQRRLLRCSPVVLIVVFSKRKHNLKTSEWFSSFRNWVSTNFSHGVRSWHQIENSSMRFQTHLGNFFLVWTCWL